MLVFLREAALVVRNVMPALGDPIQVEYVCGVYIYTYVCVYTQIHTYIYICVCVCIHHTHKLFKHTCICVCYHLHVFCVYIYAHNHIQIHTYIHTYIHIHTYIYTYYIYMRLDSEVFKEWRVPREGTTWTYWASFSRLPTGQDPHIGDCAACCPT